MQQEVLAPATSQKNVKRTYDQMVSSEQTESTSKCLDKIPSKIIKPEPKTKLDRSEKKERAFIYDAYTQRRGDPKMLEIMCARCRKYVMSYQKDGPGALLRCYLDRIHEPRDLKERQYQHFDVRTISRLRCPSCSTIIGLPMIYKLENRPAYRMLRNTFYF